MGGNLSESSGGPRAVKYGVTKDYVLNVEVVLPCGEITWTGANVLKNATGYNLTQLMVGSEGTLASSPKLSLSLYLTPLRTWCCWCLSGKKKRRQQLYPAYLPQV
nr:FAD-binding protein [Pontibacter sp. BAB1700]